MENKKRNKIAFLLPLNILFTFRELKSNKNMMVWINTSFKMNYKYVQLMTD